MAFPILAHLPSFCHLFGYVWPVLPIVAYDERKTSLLHSSAVEAFDPAGGVAGAGRSGRLFMGMLAVVEYRDRRPGLRRIGRGR
jgi:hypothetical protein